MTVMSALTKLSPVSTTRRYACLSSSSASASECPLSPCRWGMTTPPRISFRRSENRCESYPMPTRISRLHDAHGEVPGVLGVVDPDAGDRHAARHLRGREQRVEPVQGSDRERHADHGEICQRGGEPWKGGGKPRPGDDYLEPLLPGVLHEVRGLIGLPVGGRDMELVRNARLAQHLASGLDPRLVTLGSH